MALPSGTINWPEEYRKGYKNQVSDEGKIRFLLMLKERAQRQADSSAREVLHELIDLWVKEPFKL